MVVMDQLFVVFEKHQYYNISDLIRLTNQPIVSCFNFILTLWDGGWGKGIKVVMDKLFSVFEKHQYYNISNLVRLTSQPIVSPFVLIFPLLLLSFSTHFYTPLFGPCQ